MTRKAIEDMVLDNLGQQLRSQSDINTRISKAFSAWFQALVEPPPPPTDPAAGGEAAPAPGG